MMNHPLPGNPVRGSKTGKPIMALFDLLGRSWSMGIIWYLNKSPCRFRKLQEYCQGPSPTILNKRLKELKAAGIIELSIDGYILTELGNELFEMIYPLGLWASKWANKINESL